MSSLERQLRRIPQVRPMNGTFSSFNVVVDILFLFFRRVSSHRLLQRKREEVTRGAISHADTWRMRRLPRIHNRREISRTTFRAFQTTATLIFKRHLFYGLVLCVDFRFSWWWFMERWKEEKKKEILGVGTNILGWWWLWIWWWLTVDVFGYKLLQTHKL